MLSRRHRRESAAAAALPAWATWRADGAAPWSVGVEEEVMLLDAVTWSLASRVDEVLDALPAGLAGSVAAGTHPCTLELRTKPHATVAETVDELAGLRARLGAALTPLGLRAAAAGMHPLADWSAGDPPSSTRCRPFPEGLEELGEREPTFALHVHVAVPRAELATAALGRVRAYVPVLLALSANSPFCQDRETGLASARIMHFDGVTVGLPRRFTDFDDYVATAGADRPWWDVRLQPSLGTLEIRVMDAQTRVEDVAVLAAMVQAIVHLESTDRYADAAASNPAALEENRRHAAAAGMRASFLVPGVDRPISARLALEETLKVLRPHAAALGSRAELARALDLADDAGEARQRRLAPLRRGEVGGGRRLRRLMASLSADFTHGDPVDAGSGAAPLAAR